jgi:hypothetical protein
LRRDEHPSSQKNRTRLEVESQLAWPDAKIAAADD